MAKGIVKRLGILALAAAICVLSACRVQTSTEGTIAHISPTPLASGVINPTESATPSPSPSPTSTPAPTAEPTPPPTPTAEPVGRALSVYRLSEAERAYFIAQGLNDNVAKLALSKLQLDPNKPVIALTFDDGPSENTDSILDVLEQYGVRATFFVLGYKVEDHSEQIQRAINLNCEIGSHTWAHARYVDRSSAQLATDLQRTEDALWTVANYKPRLFRPPYGQLSTSIREGAKQLGYVMILWNVDTRDWEHRNAEMVIDSALKDAKDGSIILFHDLYASTAEAIETIVPALIEQGYQLVTVSELLFFAAAYPEAGDRFFGIKEWRE